MQSIYPHFLKYTSIFPCMKSLQSHEFEIQILEKGYRRDIPWINYYPQCVLRNPLLSNTWIVTQWNVWKFRGWDKQTLWKGSGSFPGRFGYQMRYKHTFRIFWIWKLWGIVVLVQSVMCFWHPVNSCLADSQQQGRSCSGFLTQRLLNSAGKSPESPRRSSSRKEIWPPLAFYVSYSDMLLVFNIC